MKVTNRCKGLDLIGCLKKYGQRFITLYRMWWPKPFPRKRNAKWLSEQALQIAEKRREVKGNGEKERYTYLNAEFQRIARRNKAFLSEQCKEIEENNRNQKTRSVFIPIPKRGNAHECSNYCTIALISHAVKIMLKILQATL